MKMGKALKAIFFKSLGPDFFVYLSGFDFRSW